MHGRREQEGLKGWVATEERGKEGAIKQARRQEHKKREGNLAQSRKSRLDISEGEKERQRDGGGRTRETWINEHFGRCYQNLT